MSKRKCLVMVRAYDGYMRRNSKMRVSSKNADIICRALNENNWALDVGYKWIVRDDIEIYSDFGRAYISHGYLRVKYCSEFKR